MYILNTRREGSIIVFLIYYDRMIIIIIQQLVKRIMIFLNFYMFRNKLGKICKTKCIYKSRIVPTLFITNIGKIYFSKISEFVSTTIIKS